MELKDKGYRIVVTTTTPGEEDQKHEAMGILGVLLQKENAQILSHGSYPVTVLLNAVEGFVETMLEKAKGYDEPIIYEMMVTMLRDLIMRHVAKIDHLIDWGEEGPAE